MIYIYVAIVAVFSFSPLFSYAALTDNIISHWDLDETSGVRSDSVTASGNDLTDNNTVLYGTGKIDNAGDFERSNSEYLSITDASQTSLDISGDFSVSSWLYLESAPSSGQQYGVISKWGTAGNRAYDFYYWNNGGTPNLTLQTSNDGTATGYASINQTLSTATWTHVVATFDASASEYSLYVDNSLVATSSGTLHTSIANGGARFEIGTNSEASNFWDGLIDEVAIWDKVLTSDEVSELYNSGSGLTYPFTASGGDSDNTSSSTPIAVDNLTAVHFQFFAFLVMMIGFWTVIWIWSIHRR